MAKQKATTKDGAKRWRAFGSVSGGKYLGEFEAATEEEAREMALENASVSLCHHCAHECENAEIGEITVEPA